MGAKDNISSMRHGRVQPWDAVAERWDRRRNGVLPRGMARRADSMERSVRFLLAHFGLGFAGLGPLQVTFTLAFACYWALVRRVPWL